jgi:hypothetical protein
MFFLRSLALNPAVMFEVPFDKAELAAVGITRDEGEDFRFWDFALRAERFWCELHSRPPLIGTGRF